MRKGSKFLPTLLARFEEKYTPEPMSGCWLWIGALRGGSSYGNIRAGGKLRLAHRVSWALHKGSPGDLDVLHKCDNPFCVNPDHLYLGTHQDNMRDFWERGRFKSEFHKDFANITKIGTAALLKFNAAHTGVKHPRASLTQEQVNEIRAGGHPKLLAKKFGVHFFTIYRVRNGETYK